MHAFNFIKYFKEEEKNGGDYWGFLYATSETLSNENIYLGKISEIMKEITNTNLKIKMKKKIFDLIMENGIYYEGLEYSLDIFSSDELKILFKHEYDVRIVKYVSNQNEIRSHISDIISFIDLLKKTNDNKWEYHMITTILDIIKDYRDK